MITININLYSVCFVMLACVCDRPDGKNVPFWRCYKCSLSTSGRHALFMGLLGVNNIQIFTKIWLNNNIHLSELG